LKKEKEKMKAIDNKKKKKKNWIENKQIEKGPKEE
jgi:hypothetical protein